jgi:hypothetical protein
MSCDLDPQVQHTLILQAAAQQGMRRRQGLSHPRQRHPAASMHNTQCHVMQTHKLYISCTYLDLAGSSSARNEKTTGTDPPTPTPPSSLIATRAPTLRAPADMMPKKAFMRSATSREVLRPAARGYGRGGRGSGWVVCVLGWCVKWDAGGQQEAWDDHWLLLMYGSVKSQVRIL